MDIARPSNARKKRIRNSIYIGVGLLAVLGVAFIHHAVAGQFAAALLFAALVSLLELSYER